MEMLSNYEVPVHMDITSARGNRFTVDGTALVYPDRSVDLSGVKFSANENIKIYPFYIGGSLYSIKELAILEARLMSGRAVDIVRDGVKGLAVSRVDLVEVETLSGKKLVHRDLCAYDYYQERRLRSEMVSAWAGEGRTSYAWKGAVHECPHCGGLVVDGKHCGKCEKKIGGEWILKSELARVVDSSGNSNWIQKKDAEERGLETCWNCGAYIEGRVHPSGLCSDCLNSDDDDDQIIEDYGVSHDNNDAPNFVGDFGGKPDSRKKAFGFELEVDKNSWSYSSEPCKKMNCEMARKIASLIGSGNIRFATDGSLNDGFEIITQPHSPDAFWRRQNDFAKMLDLLVEWGYKSHSAGTCGLHVHLSRAWFGKTEKEQSLAIAKLFAFFYNRWDDIRKASRRSDFSYCHRNEYAKLENGEWSVGNAVLKWRYCAKKRHSGAIHHGDGSAWSHYVALNNNNKNTVEIRVGRGTLNKASFFAWIDFCLALARNASKVVIADCEQHGSAEKWLMGIRESTARYLWKKGAFKKEISALFPEVEWEDDGRDSSN
jgi:hypothetical protein